jgi:lysozyme
MERFFAAISAVLLLVFAGWTWANEETGAWQSAANLQLPPNPQSGASQRLQDDLQDLQDDPSRKDLFEIIKQVEETEDPSMHVEALKLFNLYGPFRFPNDTLFDVTLGKQRVNSIFGVDINHYTRDDFPIDVIERKNIRFVYLKASQGARFKDGKFATFWDQLEVHPVHRGAYHFLSADVDPTAQAQTFLRVVISNGGLKPTDMPPVLDLEWDKDRTTRDHWRGKAPDDIIARVKAWLAHVQETTRRKPLLYTSRAWWRERIGSEAKFAQLSAYALWVADYSKSSRAVEVPTPTETALNVPPGPLSSLPGHPEIKVFSTQDEYPIRGIDVPLWDKMFDKFDWEEAKERNSIRFVYARAVSARGKVVEDFTYHWRALKKAGFDRGAYLVYNYCRKPEQQLADLASILPSDSDMLPVAIDLEPPLTEQRRCQRTADIHTLRSDVLELAGRLEEAYGKVPIIYGTRMVFRSLGTGFEKYMIWLARLRYAESGKPTASDIALRGTNPWTLWQYTQKLVVPGVGYSVDGNVFFGTEGQYREFKRGKTNAALAAALTAPK